MAFDAETLLAKATDNVTSGRSFGPIVEREGCTLVPAAYVIAVGGGGGGESPASAENPGSGGGAGWVNFSGPLGAYVIKDGDVRWVPAFDVTRLAVAGLGVVTTLLSLRRRSRRGR